ncbi:hypothetical protein GCM10009133_17150 [Cocleimonas flava]|uniref:Uncharacterized protein n=1 Tax=Cocleimonas flava TaxID=634765 RepID=A0A4R1F2Q0_9GAMM|nr:Ig-like domain-containing protein [Cocleimonas flava]TCJ84641.1 hypothetical protein EV695_2600 [Cocleimonas flava]
MISLLVFKSLKSYLLILLIGGLQITSLYAEEISNPINVGDIETNSSIKSDWLGLNYFPLDDSDDIPQTESERINWKVATMADDENSLFIFYENNFSNISETTTHGSRLGFSWGYQVFLDTDDSSDTGFQLSNVFGADYVIEGNVLMKYEGSGSNWNWSTLGALSSNFSATKVEYKLSRVSIGNPKKIKAVFQGSNYAFGGVTTDLYPNGAFDDNASTRYFTYKLADSPNIGANTPPVLNDLHFVVPKNSRELGYNIDGTDVDSQFLTYEILSTPQNGSFWFRWFGDVDYVIFYSPNQGFVGEDTFTYKASDSVDDSRIATVTFNVVEDNSLDSYSNVVDDESMVIDGQISEWDSVKAFTDIDRIVQTASGPDWINASLAHSNDNLYLYQKNRNPIVTDELSGNYIPWIYQVYLDTDQNKDSGYLLSDGIGAEYMIEGNYLYFYNGSGSDWNWQELSELEASFAGNLSEIKIPRNLISFTQSNFNLSFYGNGYSRVIYPSTSNRFFEYSIGAGVSAPELNIADRQEGLIKSPLSHQPVASTSIENSTDTTTGTSSGGGLFSYWFILFGVSLLVTRRKFNAKF